MLKRLEALDWLRGLMAFSIMLYHLVGKNDAATLLGKLGIYGVSVFFVLSGLSMAIAYDRYIKGARSAGTFIIRRLFRIWPLLWLAVALVAVPAHMSGRPYGVGMIGLNLTALFGFVAPTSYINMGAWSIGNEAVYYVLTPPLIAIYHYRRWLGNAITLVAVLVGFFFAFHILNPAMPLASQWRTYINPFNNLFLYCLGLAIYYNCRDLDISICWQFSLLATAITAFVLYPSVGDTINIVTGIHRVALSLISVAIVLAFYKCTLLLPNVASKTLEQLGIATYGIYLLHPIIMEWVRNALQAFGFYNPYLFVFLTVSLTIATALFVFKFFESPFIDMGRRITVGGAR